MLHCTPSENRSDIAYTWVCRLSHLPNILLNKIHNSIHFPDLHLSVQNCAEGRGTQKSLPATVSLDNRRHSTKHIRHNTGQIYNSAHIFNTIGNHQDHHSTTDSNTKSQQNTTIKTMHIHPAQSKCTTKCWTSAHSLHSS